MVSVISNMNNRIKNRDIIYFLLFIRGDPEDPSFVDTS